MWILVAGSTLGIRVFVGAWTVHGFAPSVISSTAIAVDAGGAVHILYADGHLRYATNSGGSWTTTDLDSALSVYSVAAALDSRDRLHVVYEGSMRSNFTYTYGPAIEYLTNSGGTWKHRTIDFNGRLPSIAVDSHDAVHIAYSHFSPGNSSIDIGNESVRYATNSGGMWTNSTLWGWRAYPDQIPYRTGLVVDSKGAIHLIYDFSHFLRYITNETGSWTREWLDGIEDSDQNPSLSVDSAGRTHLAFLGYVAKNGTTLIRQSLVHAVHEPSGWSFEAAAAWDGGYPSSTASTMDSRGRVHVTVVDGTSGVVYVTNADGGWSTSTIDGGGAVGLGASIAVDSHGRPHVSYADHGVSPGGRYATTVVNVSNLADYLLGSIPPLFLELLVMLAVVLFAPTILRRLKGRREGSRKNPINPERPNQGVMSATNDPYGHRLGIPGTGSIRWRQPANSVSVIPIGRRTRRSVGVEEEILARVCVTEAQDC